MYKVLLIDDEFFIREGMKKVIPWESFNCELVGEAENGEEGVEKILKLQPDIVISDIRMPKKDGLEMIEEIQTINNKMQVIILTGFREFEYAQQAIRLGVLRFLLKPSKIDEIKEAVTAAVARLDEFKEEEGAQVAATQAIEEEKAVVVEKSEIGRASRREKCKS